MNINNACDSESSFHTSLTVTNETMKQAEVVKQTSDYSGIRLTGVFMMLVIFSHLLAMIYRSATHAAQKKYSTDSAAERCAFSDSTIYTLSATCSFFLPF